MPATTTTTETTAPTTTTTTGTPTPTPTTTTTETPTPTPTTTATVEPKKQILESGVIFLAFQPHNINNDKKHYLIASEDGKGIFIKKTKLGDGKTEKFVLGLDENPGDTSSGNGKVDSFVALVSGIDGEADTRLQFDESNSTGGGSGSGTSTGEVRNRVEFTLAPIPPEPFRQTNVNKGEADDFDFIKDGDLIFLTLMKDKEKWTIWLTSSKAKNPYTQRISSHLDLSLGSPVDHAKSLTWTHLGPKVETGTTASSGGSGGSGTTQTQTASPAQILLKGFAVYDSPTLATNVEAVSSLNNHFIKKFIN